MAYEKGKTGAEMRQSGAKGADALTAIRDGCPAFGSSTADGACLPCGYSEAVPFFVRLCRFSCPPSVVLPPQAGRTAGGYTRLQAPQTAIRWRTSLVTASRPGPLNFLGSYSAGSPERDCRAASV